MKLNIAFITSLLLSSILLLSLFNLSKRQRFDANGSKRIEKPRDKLLKGLLTAEFDEDSCFSRYESSIYRKNSSYEPSSYLVSKLRNYEMLHKRCGPNTEAYKIATKQLSEDKEFNVSSYGQECRYAVWIAGFGLGNRVLTLAAVFLYAILTERVMLVDPRKDISDLFCEPFPGTSWLLPMDFPLMNQMNSFNKEYSKCYGKLKRTKGLNSSTTNVVFRHLYVHILHDSGDFDKMFFCEEDQNVTNKVPWLIFRANVYFVPSLWLASRFQVELTNLFPHKDATFHLLARYLFHPTNQVWGMITRSYNAYLSRADEKLGVQIRVFARRAGYFQHVMDQIVSCIQLNKLLPEQGVSEMRTNLSETSKLKAVLVTSLYPEYSETLKNIYWQHPSSNGDIVEVYQPSIERFQQTDRKLHDQKALTEMYLLSLTDNIVTSARSTFGYVAYSLGGLKPWLLYQPMSNKAPSPPCVRADSIEPCFLTAPVHGCGANLRSDPAKIVPFVRHCEDIRNQGLKVFDDTLNEL